MEGRKVSVHDKQDVEQARRWWRKEEEEEEREEGGGGTRAGLSPLTTGPGLPSNP